MEADSRATSLLVEDADGEPRSVGWRARATGMPLRDALAQASEVRYCGIKLSPRLAYLVSMLGEQQDMSRDTFMRHILAEHVAAQTGEDYDDLIGGIPPTRGRRAPAKGAKFRV